MRRIKVNFKQKTLLFLISVMLNLANCADNEGFQKLFSDYSNMTLIGRPWMLGIGENCVPEAQTIFWAGLFPNAK